MYHLNKWVKLGVCGRRSRPHTPVPQVIEMLQTDDQKDSSGSS